MKTSHKSDELTNLKNRGATNRVPVMAMTSFPFNVHFFLPLSPTIVSGLDCVSNTTSVYKKQEMLLTLREDMGLHMCFGSCSYF
jgi:hypothetical protein